MSLLLTWHAQARDERPSSTLAGHELIVNWMFLTCVASPYVASTASNVNQEQAERCEPHVHFHLTDYCVAIPGRAISQQERREEARHGERELSSTLCRHACTETRLPNACRRPLQSARTESVVPKVFHSLRSLTMCTSLKRPEISGENTPDFVTSHRPCPRIMTTQTNTPFFCFPTKDRPIYQNTTVCLFHENAD